ncbi:uncharacterized protein LOC130901526 [Diorhabda carinulata]|uniref:uncharacterized protein LOC130453386 n=1 Tax=Diorhabda sublineata TaxID=1163346 RepID=UPI0024E0DF61|nr:uncharacterized protein LOC130453386 [Diorhabda sublineata]XP_057668957.1 uncharacterized protein LOC130901526 [Diorhabda carinulata]
MFSPIVFRIKILLFCLLFNQSLSLECFTCSSQTNLNSDMYSRCEYVDYSYYDKSNLSHCPSPNVCAKYIVEHDGVKWVHRACQPRDICSFIAARYNDPRNILIDCQTCSDENACNSIGKIIPFSILFLLPLFLVKL